MALFRVSPMVPLVILPMVPLVTNGFTNGTIGRTLNDIGIPFLAHLSRRLTGELIGYPWIRRPSSVHRRRPFTFSNIFSFETAWPIKAKFYVEPPWEGGTKVYINSQGHMTKMAAMPIYGKNPSKIFFSRTGGQIFTKLGM